MYELFCNVFQPFILHVMLIYRRYFHELVESEYKSYRKHRQLQYKSRYHTGRYYNASERHDITYHAEPRVSARGEKSAYHGGVQ